MGFGTLGYRFGRLGASFGQVGGQAGPYIALSANSLDENSAQGTAIGALSVLRGSGTYAFTLTESGGGKAQLDAGDDTALQAGATPTDYETATFFTITVEADNGVDPVISRSFIINVNDVAEVNVALMANFSDPNNTEAWVFW